MAKLHYKKLSFNEQIKFKRYLQDIESAAQFFREHFVGKKMCYETTSQSISLIFKSSNFMHLCGIDYADGANEFFNVALLKQINLAKVRIKSDGTTFQKLSVLRSISFLLSPELQLTNGAIYLHLQFDKSLKTNKKIFALTLLDKGNFIPQSLLDLKKIHHFPAGEKVISIKSVHLQSQAMIAYL